MIVPHQQIFERLRRWRAHAHHLLDTGFHLVHVLAETHRASHPRAALDRVQQAQYRLRQRGVSRLLLPAAQRLPHLRQHVAAFFDEYRQQVGIQLVLQSQCRVRMRIVLGREHGLLERRVGNAFGQRALVRNRRTRVGRTRRHRRVHHRDVRHLDARGRLGLTGRRGVAGARRNRFGARRMGGKRGRQFQACVDPLLHALKDLHLLRLMVRHFAQREHLQHETDPFDRMLERVVFFAGETARLARQILQHGLQCVRDFLQRLEAYRGRTSGQRMRGVHRMNVDVAIRLMAPLGDVLRQQAHQFVGLRKVDIMQRQTDFQFTDALDVVILLRLQAGEVDYLRERHVERRCRVNVERRRDAGLCNSRGEFCARVGGLAERFAMLQRREIGIGQLHFLGLQQHRRNVRVRLRRGFEQQVQGGHLIEIRGRPCSRLRHAGLLRCRFRCLRFRRYVVRHRGGWQRCSDRRWPRILVQEGAAQLHALGRGRQRSRCAIRCAIGLQIRDPGAQDFRRLVQQCVQIGIAGARFGQPEIDHLLDAPGRLAERDQADHAPAALEGMERAAQRRQVILVVRFIARRRRRFLHAGQHFFRLGQENLQQFGIDRFVGLGCRRRDDQRRGDPRGRGDDLGQSAL